MIQRLVVLAWVGLLSGCTSLNQPPVAQMTLDVVQGEVPLTVTLNGAASFDPDGRVVRWHWDFGDGASAQGETVSHTYTQDGVYTVTLTVSDNAGASARTQRQIIAGHIPLAAAFNASPLSGWAPLQVQLDARSTQAPAGATYAWDFGDGTQGSGSQTTHRYDTPGAYTVTLTVRDDQDTFDRAQVQLRVLGMTLLDTLPTVAQPTALAAGDFDGDGRLDLAASSARQASVALMKGQPNGRFAAPRAFAVGENPRNLIGEDFDQDGVIDLASANFEAGTVSVLLGQRGGGLLELPEVTVGTWPFDLAAADFDNDGLPDIAVVNAGDATLSVLHNEQQAFVQNLVLETGLWPSAVLSRDFNRDGNADLAVANFFSNSVSVYLGNGDGTFGPRSDVAVGAEPVALAAGDLDDDGRLDLLVANAGQDTVSLLANLGAGQFAVEATQPVGQRPWGVALHDLDGDGRLDLVVSTTGSGGLSAWLASGDFAFDRRRGIGIGDEPLDMVAADVDDDGLPEWLILDFAASQLILLEIE